MRLHLIELILFSTYAELRAERSRSYLGLLWWIVEPAMNMGVYYLVFAVIFNMGGPDYVAFLLVVLWSTGYPPNAAYVALLPVLLVELVFVAACTYVVAAVVPLVPDLRF